ncbi:PREDICTED: keratin-associated protein 13-1-like [Miniopterus natalensis]|uniref:keratin-associated protein 13-1-like n=1 Tax=Miniopterus natalensis TaxID=291302 RepID=UPI0007A6AC30|nr:PREDICTED: keratin-associated protein 13-1-like [Miniopterus natalensis]
MSHGCCSGNFSSCSLGGSLCHPGSSCGSSYPSNLVYSTELRSPSPCPQGSSLRSGCQETCWEPRSYQMSCCGPRTPTLCSPCWTTRPGALGSGSSSSCYSLDCGPRSSYSLGCGSRSSYSLGCGSQSSYSLGCGSYGFRPQGYGGCGFPSLSYGSGFCRPTSLASRSCQSSCYRPTCGSGFY